MSRGWLIWDGVDMRTIAGGTVKIEHVPNHNRAERKVETEKVPGRNGVIVYMQDAWHNVEQKYELVAGTVATTAAATAFREIAEWLYSPVGYCALQDSYEPGYFRRAYFKGPFDVEDMLTRYGRATVTFICRPERFTLDGEEQRSGRAHV